MNFPLKLTNATIKQLPSVKKSLRAKVPLLTPQQIRRLKLPLADALKIELEEENCPKALNLFQDILKIDNCHKNCFADGKNSNLLEEIFNLLKLLKDNTEEEELTILIEIIKKIFNEDKKFDWLIELLLIKGSQLATNYELEETKTFTILAYLHGLSLSHRLHWYRAASLQFELAFKIALNNNDWTYEDENFSVKISKDLSDCLIKLSKIIRIDENNPQEGSIYSRRALTVLRTIFDDKNLNYEIDAEIELGNCLLDQRLFNEAKEHFEHGLVLSEKCGLKEKFCESLAKIAKCHKGLENFEMYEKLMHIAKDYASENSLTKLKGDILLILMEICTENLNIEKIGEIFVEGFDYFTLVNDQQKMLETEALYSYAGAKLHFNQVVDAILKADKGQVGDNSYLQKLIIWIDQKSSKLLESFDEPEDLNLEDFIKKYYDPDEITKLERHTI